MDRPEHMSKFDLEISYRKNAQMQMSYAPHNPNVVRNLDFVSSRFLGEEGEGVGSLGGGVLYLQSNCQEERDGFVSELMSFMRVDCMGKCLHNTPFPPGISQLELLGGYKFVITFENSKYDDYVTERVYNAWIAGAVPIYSGAPNIRDYAPHPHAYIDPNDFENVFELAEYIQYLQSNETARQEHLQFKDPSQPLSPGFLKAAKNSMYSSAHDSGKMHSDRGGGGGVSF